MKRMTIAAMACLLATGARAQTAAPPLAATVQAAARAGDASAQFALAEAYRTGQGMPVDREQAITWYRRAADQGNLPARDALGTLLFTRGNRQEAMPLIEAAAGRGDARALYILATARFNGDYVARDWPRAYAEMSRSAELGLPQAKRSLALMEPYLLPADRAKADAIRATMAAVAAPEAPASAPAGDIAPPPRLAPPLAAPTTEDAFPMRPPASRPAPPPLVAATPPRAVPSPSVARPSNVAALAPTPAPVPTPARAAPATANAPQSSPPVTRPTPAPAPPPTPTPILATTPRPAAPSAAPRGNWRVQLGAYGSRERAEVQWANLAAKVPALGRLERRITPAGAVVRLQADGLAGRDAADALCRQVTGARGACFTLAPAP